MEAQLSAALIAKSLNYHGQQLQKIWESERGENDLYKIGVPTPDFAEYQARQKFLNFQDRGKRLKLQQFIAKKANYLFDVDLLQEATTTDKARADEKDAEKMFAVLPPFELFMNMDKTNRQRHFFEVVKPGDLVMGTVINKSASGMLLKILCTVGQGCSCRYVADINVKAFCSVSNTIPAFDVKKNMTRGYAVNDTVICEVLEVIPDTDKMSVGMKGTLRHTEDPSAPPLGLIHADDYPNMYKKALDAKGETYNTMLSKCAGFSNPTCVQYLSDVLGLGSEHHSNMKGFRKRFPQQEYVNELRQLQASKWAFRSVAEGIEHFKSNRHTEAFGCLNKALSIDPRNVEGLVARGALYANTGSFKKAIEDFEMALKLNPSHANARKYMGETLVALGRSYEDEHKYDEARKAYQDCLAIIPYHEEAKNSIEFLKTKNGGVKPLIDAGELLLPNIASRQALQEDGGAGESRKDGSTKKKKKKGGKTKKRRNNSSSTSSSSTSDSSQSSESSSESSSDNSSSSSGSENETGKRRKKKRASRDQSKARGSLSPLSKRMALMDPQQPHSNTASTIVQFNKGAPQPSGDDYEQKVRKFLEMTREDSDYEEKVRKFLEETARFKKIKSGLGDAENAVKPKRKKNKKDKSGGKVKKESKRKRKERERKERKALKRARPFDLREFEQQMESKKFRDALRKELSSHKHGNIFDESMSASKKRRSRNISTDDDKVFNPIQKDLDDLDELETKLNAYYAKMEKDNMSKRSGSQLSLHHDDSPHRREHKNSMGRDQYLTEQDSADGKWKMQFGKDNRFVSKPEPPKNKPKSYPFAASESDDEMRQSANNIPLPSTSNINESNNKQNMNNTRHKQSTKPVPPPSRKLDADLVKPPSPKQPKGNVVLDKFGNFRLVEEPAPLPPLSKPDDSMDRKSRSRSKPRNYRSSSSRSSRGKRSRSPGSYRKYSRSRSRSRSYNSASRSRSRSRSSRSYGSRSRSRSYRSNSRNRRYDRRMNHRGRGSWDNRGTYYKPRFNNSFQNQNRGGFRGRGFRDNYDRNYRGGRGHRGGYNNNYRNRGRGNMNHRGRFFNRGGFRDYRDRRYDRRSRDRSEDRRSYSDEEDRKERKMDERRNSDTEQDQPPPGYIDHKEIEGKWADVKEVSKEEQQNTLDEMNKIIDKIKKDKDSQKEPKETW